MAIKNVTQNCEPDPYRIERVQRWHFDQGMSEVKPAAVMAITLTDDSMVVTDGLVFDLGQARIMLPAIYALAEKMESLLDGCRPDIRLVRSDCTESAKKNTRRAKVKFAPLRLVDSQS